MFRGDRLAALMERSGISQSELGRRIGVSQASIWKLIHEDSQGSKYTHRLARELRTTPEYLMGEADDPDAGFIPSPSVTDVAVELGLVPVPEIDLRYGMGATELDLPVTTTIRHFSREWLRQYTHADPDHLYFAQGIGDSMFPTIWDSDLLLIDTSDRQLRLSDKIWAVAYGQSGMVKRLRPMADGSVKILSDNQSVPAETAFDGELHVLGRVVGIVRKM